MEISRRNWLLGSIALPPWSEIAAAQQQARQATTFEVLDRATAAELDAITAQILPSTDGPGAREAGVVFFIDRALATFDAAKKDEYRQGLEAIQHTRKKMFPDSYSIAALSSDQQIQLLRAVETLPFFETLRVHTLCGFLGDPSYGGNRDFIGWKHIGMEHRMIFTPPFGYYDAEETKR